MSDLGEHLKDDLNDEATSLERIIFTAINNGDIEELRNVLKDENKSTAILQLLLTTAYPNDDNFYNFENEVQNDAVELLGDSVLSLNALHISCIQGEEEMAQLLLEFVSDITQEINAKKVLYEFMGRVWGNGNTVLHLAAFMGMSNIVKRLLELGAAPNKMNERKYKPVDCCDDDITRGMFTNVTECILF